MLAMGGQGGGVLADWIVALAEMRGLGGAIDLRAGRRPAHRRDDLLHRDAAAAKTACAPVFSLMPTPGDVDVVMAAELMEAGRSVLRGLVTPDKTTLIASTHRAYAVAEKEKPGDGVGDPVVVVDAADVAARRTIALRHGEARGERRQRDLGRDVRRARRLRRAAVRARLTRRSSRAGGSGAKPSLAAFADAFDRARAGEPCEAPNAGPPKRFDAAGGCRPSRARRARCAASRRIAARARTAAVRRD